MLLVTVWIALEGATQARSEPRSEGDIGGLHVAITQAPREFDHRRTRRMVYKIVVAAGSTEQRFSLSADPPRFPDGGTPLIGPAGVGFKVSGPARLGTSRQMFANVACSPYNVVHGAEPVGHSVDVTAPVSTTSTISIAYRVARHDAPQPGMEVRPTFTFRRALLDPRGDGPPTFPRDLRVAPPVPRLNGPSGVLIRMRTRPRTVPGFQGPVPRYRRGRVIRVRGRTSPRVRRQVIELRTLGPSGRVRRPRTIGRVRTDGRGRFVYRWRPRARGLHQLFAFYRRQQKGVTSDRACPRLVRVGARN